MVLHVVANVEREIVPRSVVGIGLVTAIKHVVLSDKVRRHGVETHAEKRTYNHVVERLETEKVPYQRIKYQLYGYV